MILARCPACGTTFRVRPEQVQARAGRVRCGHCKHAFNALDARLDDTPSVETPTGAALMAASAEAPLFVLEEKHPNAPDPIAPPPDETAPEAPEEVPVADAPPTDAPTDVPIPAADAGDEPAPADFGPDGGEIEAPATATESATEPEAPPQDAEPAEPGPFDIEFSTDFLADLDTPAPERARSEADQRIEPFAGIDIAEEWPPGEDIPVPPAKAATAPAGQPVEAPAFQPDWPDASELDLKPQQGEPIDFDALLHKQDRDDTPLHALAAADDQPWPASEEPAAMLAQPRAGLTARVEPVGAVESEAEPAARIVSANTEETRAEPEDDDSDDEAQALPPDEPETPALRQAAWAAGATLLVLTLLAQGVLVFRSEIVQSSPQMRPFMESLCAGIGCELPLPRNAAQIAIESSDIQPDANREAFFTLQATLRNRAEYAQAYPHLEITLTDARDKALVRKVLEPAQWLPADAARDAFGPQREVSTRIGFEAPGVAAAGYRVYVFYP